MVDLIGALITVYPVLLYVLKISTEMESML